METYQLNLGREDLRPVSYSELRSLTDCVLVVDILPDDPPVNGRVVVGEKLVGIVMQNSLPSVFGVRFKENSSGKHIIAGERYQRMNYSPQDLVLNPDNFATRNPQALVNRDNDYPTSHILKGIIEGL